MSFTLLGLLCVLTTGVFCFWFLYLLQAIIHRRNIYKKALRCLEASSDYTQQITVWNAESELIKNIFLFFINLAEWFAVIIVLVAYIVNNAEIQVCPNRKNKTEISPPDSSLILCLLHYYEHTIVSRFFEYFAKNLLVLSIVLVGSLCRYLAGRYTQITWVKSNNISRIIGIFVIYSVVNQFLVVFDLIEIIVLLKWLSTLLFTLSLIFALKGYMKLCMVINWTIVDLKVRGNKPKLVARHITMKRKSTRIFTVTMIGVFTILFAQYIQDTLITVWLMVQRNFSVESLLQGNPHETIVIIDILNIIRPVGYYISTIGILLMSVPYTGYGLATMFTVAWRLYKGKSGYRTHFPNRLLHGTSYKPNRDIFV